MYIRLLVCLGNTVGDFPASAKHFISFHFISFYFVYFISFHLSGLDSSVEWFR